MSRLSIHRVDKSGCDAACGAARGHTPSLRAIHASAHAGRSMQFCRELLARCSPGQLSDWRVRDAPADGFPLPLRERVRERGATRRELSVFVTATSNYDLRGRCAHRSSRPRLTPLPNPPPQGGREPEQRAHLTLISTATAIGHLGARWRLAWRRQRDYKTDDVIGPTSPELAAPRHICVPPRTRSRPARSRPARR